MCKEKKVLIIGNGGSVLTRRVGHLIDRFDGDIVRLNDFAIKDYEQHVGTRTDIWITHKGWDYKTKMSDVPVRPMFIPKEILKSVILKVDYNNPSTGIQAIEYFMQKGKEVWIYGFDHFDNNGLPTEYFGMLPGVSDHNGVKERAYVDQLIYHGHLPDVERRYINAVTVKRFAEFTEPVLTVVMPFHNEGDEPQKTLQSLFDNTPEGSFNVIAIDDKSDRNRNGVLKSFPRVTVIRNLVRRGVDSSRTLGAYRAATKYVMFIDAHMRFSSGWLDAYLRELEKHDHNVVYCKTEHLTYDYDTPVVNTDTRPKHGCCFSLFKDGEVLSMKWIRDKPKEKVTETNGLMGANYAMHLDFFKQMRGLEGLREYGMSEEFLALKTLWFGGKIIYIDDVVISHLYRNVPVYATDNTNYLYNKLFIIRTLFTVKFGDILISKLEPSGQLGVATGQIKSNKDYIRAMKAAFDKEKKYTFRRFVNKYEL